MRPAASITCGETNPTVLQRHLTVAFEVLADKAVGSNKKNSHPRAFLY